MNQGRERAVSSPNERRKTDPGGYLEAPKWHFAIEPSPAQARRGIKPEEECLSASNKGGSLYIVLVHVTKHFLIKTH
jgi:hypothetical protein